MKGNEIRKRFLDFFAKRDHTIIPSAPLVPENDPTVLFNTAGMQPLVPYLLGQPHPTGATRIADSQKCVRTNDLDEVGDNTHLTFFEMLGNWSLGDYFKKEAIEWSFEFLTSKTEGLGLDPKRLYVTVFAGDKNSPRDDEAYEVWKSIFTKHNMDPDSRIFYMDATENWWSPGDNGPCGPDSEMFYDVTGKHNSGLTLEGFKMADDKQEIVEIWNNVFMEYEKRDGQVIGKLTFQNVDTGSGLERITAMVQGVDNIFATDLFIPIISKITELAENNNPRAVRIIADHIRAATFLISDGVAVSNTDQGYILRRLLRRSVRQADKLALPEFSLSQIAEVVITEYAEAYENLITKKETIVNTIDEEEKQFRKTLQKGLKELKRSITEVGKVSGYDAFVLFTTYGFPFELTEEVAKENGYEIDTATREAFYEQMQLHKEKSRAGAEQKFKGGLADHSDKVVQYHTVTHLLLAGLQNELGDHVHQAGSNITAERLRFDFTHSEKVAPETLSKIEDWINKKLEAGGEVIIETVTKSEAEKDSTVEGSFWEKYPDIVNIYTIKDKNGDVISRELCGGPHVEKLDDISGQFKIKKESSSAQGIRRIKAVLE